jgi:photosystem II stability/assembly factor-like uncharacterized protein
MLWPLLWPLLWLALVMASVRPTATAYANGRPPVTNGVFFQANDNQSLYVRSTFGLLISHDGGCSFRWTCEQNIGYGGSFDPAYAIAADGTLFATTFTGLRVSRDGGCSFTTATDELPADAPGRIAGMWVDAIDIGPTGEVWVATADSIKPNDVLRSTDGGVTFVSRGATLPAMWWKSVVVAPSDAMHVYVSGYQVANAPPTAQVLSTTDGGQSWVPATMTGIQLAGTPMITVAAVDATDPKHLYIVSVGANGMGDRLYRSTDGGTTFNEVLVTTLPIVNVVIRDGMTVFVVSGEGTFRSDTGGATFGSATTTPYLACLGRRPDGKLVGCAPNWEPDFMAVADSDDASQWQKLFRFIELDGPLACPAGTTGHDICDLQLWSGVREQFGATGPTCASATDLPVDLIDAVAPSRPGGCCDAADGSPFGLGLITLLTSWIIGRRPGQRRR